MKRRWGMHNAAQNVQQCTDICSISISCNPDEPLRALPSALFLPQSSFAFLALSTLPSNSTTQPATETSVRPPRTREIVSNCDKIFDQYHSGLLARKESNRIPLSSSELSTSRLTTLFERPATLSYRWIIGVTDSIGARHGLNNIRLRNVGVF